MCGNDTSKYKMLNCSAEKINIAMLYAKIASNNYYKDQSVISGCKELADADVLCCCHVPVDEHSRAFMMTESVLLS